MALTVRRPVQLVGVLDGLGSEQADALTILVEWATGGDQKTRRGRFTTRAVLRDEDS